MWSRFANRLVMQRFGRWPWPLEGRLLPLQPVVDGWVAFTDDERQRNIRCRTLSVAGDDGIDPLCVYCAHAARCGLVDGGKRAFTPLEDRPVGWTTDDLAHAETTMELPYLALWPPRNWGLHEFGADTVFRFDRGSLLAGLDRLISANLHDLFRRPYMAWFATRRLASRDFGPTEIGHIRRRLQRLRARIDATPAGAYDRCLEEMGI